MTYETMFSINSSDSDGLFPLSQTGIKIITVTQKREYGEILRTFHTLPLFSWYLWALITFIINNVNTNYT